MKHFLISIITLCWFLLVGCQPAPPADQADLHTYSKTFANGTLTVSVNIDNSAPTIADRVMLHLEAAAPENYRVDLPGFETSLGDFTVADTRQPQPMLSNDGLVRHHADITLEPFLAGDYTVPAMEVHFRDPAGKEPVIIKTEAITIPVSSFLPANTTPELKDIVPPQPPTRNPAVILWIAAAVLAAAGLGFYLYRRYRRSRQAASTPVVLRPDQVALNELEKLLAADLVRRGKIKLFYTGLTDILRRYIENRFGIRAPEQTTEEFLAALSRPGTLPGNGLLGEHRPRLQEFLNLSDLVKFAKHLPTETESRETAEACRRFIETTAEQKTSLNSDTITSPTGNRQPATDNRQLTTGN